MNKTVIGTATKSLVRLSVVFLLISGMVGCGIRIRSSQPSESANRELASMVEANLGAEPHVAPLHFPAGPFEIELKQRFSKYFIEASLNGENAELMLDYGSGTVLGLTPYMARKARAKLTQNTRTSRTVDSVSETRIGVISSMNIADADFSNVPFDMADFDVKVVLFGFLPVYRGKGMLGMPFLASFSRFAIDMSDDRLFLGEYPESLQNKRSAVTVPIEYRDQAVFLELMIEGKPHRMTVDIGGSAKAIRLRGAAAREFMKNHTATKVGTSTGFGVGQVDVFKARASAVKIGSYLLANVDVFLVPDTPLSANAYGVGIVGNAFFGQTSVGVDLEEGTLTFLPV